MDYISHNFTTLDKNAKIYVAGHRGLVGSSLVILLKELGFNNLLIRTHEELDLRNQKDVNIFFSDNTPEYVFLFAAKVGGIKSNINYPADFIYDNISIQSNVIHASYIYKVKKLLFLGSSCIYPRITPDPIKEDYLLSGFPEPTNELYAIAKIAGLKMCQAYNKQYGTSFISVIPPNLYGSRDNFNLENSHVIPALIGRFHQAKILNLPEITIWGTGKARREFLYVDDLVQGLFFLMENYNDTEIINIGTGEDITIEDLVYKIRSIVGFNGLIKFDPSQPDGIPRKRLDISKIKNLGWKDKVSLDEGLRRTYEYYVSNNPTH